MVAWVGYATVLGCALGVAAWLAEEGLRRLDVPTRGVWLAAMVGTVGVPAILVLAGAVASPVDGGRTPPGGAGVLDGALLTAWAVSSLLLLSSLRLSAWTLRRNQRSWRTALIDGRRVLVSRDFGPGVVGGSRPRIVVPRWLLDAEPLVRTIIVDHEQEHVRARDGRLLVLGLGLAALAPWCLPLWWQLRRLREAIETDCDARVLAAGRRPRAYAHALVSVAGRPAGPLLPAPTLAPGRGELERRIRRVTAPRGDRSRGVGVGLLAMAGLLIILLAGVPAPAAPRLDIPSSAPLEIPPRATVFLSVRS